MDNFSKIFEDKAASRRSSEISIELESLIKKVFSCSKKFKGEDIAVSCEQALPHLAKAAKALEDIEQEADNF